MGKYRLTFRKSVAKDLCALPAKDIARILKRIRSLADEPRPLGCEKLSGQERYRVRQGAYRIIYEINDDGLVVIAIKVGHRGDIYRKKGDS
ncbi:MAG: type II toxin-antitoxin system RelE/ParE family toxin [Deltaproteobacteria bacterium]|nr:type II toxin-antitoxin system RelE/ParE family toxin [Deltaproteobacteria bacterium]